MKPLYAFLLAVMPAAGIAFGHFVLRPAVLAWAGLRRAAADQRLNEHFDTLPDFAKRSN